MKWPKFYLAAILLHLLVLYFLTRSPTPQSREGKHYIEVTIAEPIPTPPPLPADPHDTPQLGQGAGPQSATPSPAAPALAPTVAPETPGPITPFTRVVADRYGPTTPGTMGGTGEGTGGNGNWYKVIAVPEGLTVAEAEFAAQAWGGRLAVLDSLDEVNFVFKLADDPKFWRNAPKNGHLGPSWASDQRKFAQAAQNGRLYDDESAATENRGIDIMVESHPLKPPPSSAKPPGASPPAPLSLGSLGPWIGAHPVIMGNGPNAKSPGDQSHIVASQSRTGWAMVFDGHGYVFYGTTANSRQPNLATYSVGGASISLTKAYAYVAEFVPVPRRPNDVSVAQGHWGGHTYEVIHTPDGINWFDAQAEARARGGYLAIIRSTEENNVVFKLSQTAMVWNRESYFFRGPSFNDIDQHVVDHYTIGPWLGGFKIGGDPSFMVWRWFHPVGGPDETGVSHDKITYFNWAVDIHLDVNGLTSNDRTPAGYTAALLFLSAGGTPLPTWAAASPYVLNYSYVVEFDDPPGAGS